MVFKSGWFSSSTTIHQPDKPGTNETKELLEHDTVPIWREEGAFSFSKRKVRLDVFYITVYFVSESYSNKNVYVADYFYLKRSILTKILGINSHLNTLNLNLKA